MVIELGAIVLHVYMWHQADHVSTEDVLYQWKVLECHKHSTTCRGAFNRYVYEIMLPQVGLVVGAILLQVLLVSHLF